MIRKTRQRAAIRDAFESRGQPLSPEEVLTEAQRHVEGIGIATVYRNIRALLDEGWLVTVELPGQQARYEQAGKSHHHHFHCGKCGQVFELSGCIDGLQRMAPRGFKVSGHDLVLYGECLECQRRGRLRM
jgi:Fur family ferric uptake transcriptional regulator